MKTVKRTTNRDDFKRRERFIKNNIPYDEIDLEMLELIDILNFNLEYKTVNCCYGHFKHNDKIISTLSGINYAKERTFIDGFSVQFESHVSDQMIHKLIYNLPSLYSQCFQKWDRILDCKMLSNWHYNSMEFDNLEEKNKFLNELCNILNNINMK